MPMQHSWPYEETETGRNKVKPCTFRIKHKIDWLIDWLIHSFIHSFIHSLFLHLCNSVIQYYLKEFIADHSHLVWPFHFKVMYKVIAAFLSHIYNSYCLNRNPHKILLTVTTNTNSCTSCSVFTSTLKGIWVVYSQPCYLQNLTGLSILASG
jgi:hypothetical protein